MQTIELNTITELAAFALEAAKLGLAYKAQPNGFGYTITITGY